MVNEVSFYGQSVKNNSKKHMKTYGKNNNLIFHFALPSVLTSDYQFFSNEKKKIQVRKRSIDCSFETVSAHKSLEIFHFLHVYVIPKHIVKLPCHMCTAA